MIVELGTVKSETKGQNQVTLFRERGTNDHTLCYHPTANQPDAKPSVCWGL